MGMVDMDAAEVTVAALPAERRASLSKLYDSASPGRFLQNAHGITHFRLEEPADNTLPCKLAMLAHGVGSAMTSFDEVVPHLLRAGYRVLRYDYLCHGWSTAKEPFMKLDRDVMVKQCADLLDHLLAPGEPVDLFVGHSTGGVVATCLAADEALGRRHPIKRMALISPAVWTEKSLGTRLADRIPGLLHGLIKKRVLPAALVQKGYLDNNIIAFAKKGGGRGYLYPDRFEARHRHIKKQFAHNSQVAAGIFGCCAYFLRQDLIVAFRADLRAVAGRVGRDQQLCLIWGNRDVVVPFSHAQTVLGWAAAPGQVTLREIDAGHESVLEIPDTIGEELARFARQPPAPEAI